MVDEVNPAIGNIADVYCLLPQLVFAINYPSNLAFQDKLEKHVVDRQPVIHLMFCSSLNLKSVLFMVVHWIPNDVPSYGPYVIQRRLKMSKRVRTVSASEILLGQ